MNHSQRIVLYDSVTIFAKKIFRKREVSIFSYRCICAIEGWDAEKCFNIYGLIYCQDGSKVLDFAGAVPLPPRNDV